MCADARLYKERRKSPARPCEHGRNNIKWLVVIRLERDTFIFKKVVTLSCQMTRGVLVFATERFSPLIDYRSCKISLMSSRNRNFLHLHLYIPSKNFGLHSNCSLVDGAQRMTSTFFFLPVAHRAAVHSPWWLSFTLPCVFKSSLLYINIYKKREAGMGTSWSTRLCRSLARSTFSLTHFFSPRFLSFFFMKRQRNDSKQLVQRFFFFTNASGRMQRRKLYLAVGKKRSSLSLSFRFRSKMTHWRELFGSGDYRHSSSQDRKLFFSSSSSSSVPTLSLLKRRCALLVRRKRASRCAPPHWKRLTLFCPLSFVCCTPARVVLSVIEWWAVESKGCPLAYAKL